MYNIELYRLYYHPAGKKNLFKAEIHVSSKLKIKIEAFQELPSIPHLDVEGRYPVFFTKKGPLKADFSQSGQKGHFWVNIQEECVWLFRL